MTRLGNGFVSLLFLFLFAVPVHADIVVLDNGERISGMVEKKGNQYIIKFPDGSVVLPADRVREVIKKETDLERYYEKKKEVKSDDPEEQFALGKWAWKRDLKRQARTHLHRVLELQPDHQPAHELLGHRKYEGEWMTEEEYLKKKGYVKYRGEWVTPEVREAREALEEKKEQEERERRRSDREEELLETRKELHRVRSELERLRERRSERRYPYAEFGYYPYYPYRNRIILLDGTLFGTNHIRRRSHTPHFWRHGFRHHQNHRNKPHHFKLRNR